MKIIVDSERLESISNQLENMRLSRADEARDVQERFINKVGEELGDLARRAKLESPAQ